jgi:hypothetical protein
MSRPRFDTTVAAVVADVIHGDVVHNRRVVDVVNICHIDI